MMRPTPQMTIEAVIMSIQERGLDALDDQTNVLRLQDFDESAFATLHRRVAGAAEYTARYRLNGHAEIGDHSGTGGEWQPPSSLSEYGLPADAGSGPSRFLPVAIDDVVLPTEAPCLIERLLPTRGLACVVGPPKSRKSFFATHMLFHVAVGRDYAGRAVLPGPVVYLTGEGVVGFKRRLIALRRDFDVEGNGTPFYMIENVPDLGSERTDLAELMAELDRFIDAAGYGAPRAIALDTLARCMGEGDENTAKDMGRFIRRCAELERRFGCLVVLVHHTGKDVAKGGRGSNSLNGAADVTLTVEKSETFSTVRIDEAKDDAEGQEWRFALETVDLGETSETPTETSQNVSTCVVRLLSDPTIAKHETKQTKPRGVDGDLLAVIHRALAEVGEATAPTTVVSTGTRVISRNALKTYCNTLDWQDPEGKPDAFRAALSRSLSKLRSAGYIGFTKEWVWAV